MMNNVLRFYIRNGARCQMAQVQNQVRYFAVVKKYTKTHEWIEMDTDTMLAKVGITDFAQKQLGDIVHVEMPEEGDSISQGDTLTSIESVKTAADVYMMVDGVIEKINDELENSPETVNASAESDGWMVEIKVENKEQFDALMSLEEYKGTLP